MKAITNFRLCLECFPAFQGSWASKKLPICGIVNRTSLEALFSGKVATGQFAVSTAGASPSTTSRHNSRNDLSDDEEESVDGGL